jgi:hypothetical protein
MAMSVFPAFDASGEQLRPRLEAEVRRLLRCANNAFLLAANPLAQALCEATDSQNAQSALRRVIENAFQEGFKETQMRNMLLASLEQSPARSTNGESLRVSKRHWQRRRAEAVAILATHVQRVIGTVSSFADENESAPSDPLETIAELLSNIEPATASNLLKLGGRQSAANATMLALRERLETGADISGADSADRQLSTPLVAILRAQSKEITGKDPEPAGQLWPLIAQLARGSSDISEIRFELEWLSFLRARHGGDAWQIHRIARSLQRLSNDRSSWSVRALLAQAEAKICAGRLEEASVLLDAAGRRCIRNFAVADLAHGSALRGEVALQRADDAAAERLASGAYLVLNDRHFNAYRCQTIVARARLRLAEPWERPRNIGALTESSFDRLAINIEAARHLLAGGDGRSSRACASAAFELAAKREYNGLAARAAATLGASFGDLTEKKRTWYLRALSYLLKTRDHSVACDLFALETGGIARLFSSAPEPLVDIIYEGLANAMPQLRSELSERPAVCRFLKELIESVLWGRRAGEDLEKAIDVLSMDAAVFSQQLVYFLDNASDILHTVCQALVSAGDRARVEYRLDAALRRVPSATQADDRPRKFMVG